jgi:hypothetical protein
MGIFGKLFGSSSSKGKSTAESDELRAMLESSKGQPKKDLRARDASPKEAVQYVYRQLKQGVPPDELQADLGRRGFDAEIADSYIDLVLKTMFQGKGTKG